MAQSLYVGENKGGAVFERERASSGVGRKMRCPERESVFQVILCPFFTPVE